MSAAEWRALKQYAQVLGRRMAYVEQGSGAPIVLLHGNPTSSYLWRSVLPELSSLGRCIAPDLIGMGDSEKLPADDRCATPSCGIVSSSTVCWMSSASTARSVGGARLGSALGFDWARRHPERVRGIAYMEGLCGHTPTGMPGLRPLGRCPAPTVAGW